MRPDKETLRRSVARWISGVLIIPLAILFIPVAVSAQDVSGNQQPGTGALRPVKTLEEDTQKDESKPEEEPLPPKPTVDILPSIAPSAKSLGPMTDEPDVTIIHNQLSSKERGYEKLKPQEEKQIEKKPDFYGAPVPPGQEKFESPTWVSSPENAPITERPQKEMGEVNQPLEQFQLVEAFAMARSMFAQAIAENSVRFYAMEGERAAPSESLMPKEAMKMNEAPATVLEKIIVDSVPTAVLSVAPAANAPSILPGQELPTGASTPGPQAIAQNGQLVVGNAAAPALPLDSQAAAQQNAGAVLLGAPSAEVSDTGVIKTIERAKTVTSAEKIRSSKSSDKVSGLPEKSGGAPTWLEVLQSHMDKGNISGSTNSPQDKSSEWCVSFADSDGITEMIQRGYAQSGGPGEYTPQGPKNLYSYGSDENRIMFITVVELNVEDQPVKAARIFADGRVYVFGQLKEERFNSPPDRREGRVNYTAPVVLFSKVTNPDLGSGHQILGALKASSVLKSFLDKGRSAPKVPCPKK